MVKHRKLQSVSRHRAINWVVWLTGIWMDMNIQVFVHCIKTAMIVWTTTAVFVEDAWNDNTHVCAMWGML